MSANEAFPSMKLNLIQLVFRNCTKHDAFWLTHYLKIIDDETLSWVFKKRKDELVGSLQKK